MTSKFLVRCNKAFVAGILVSGMAGAPAGAEEPELVETDVEQVGANNVPDSGQISVPLYGRAQAARNSDLSVDSSSLDLGQVAVGDAESQVFTITHTGQLDAPAVEILDAILFGQDASEFTSDFGGNTILLPGQSVDLAITLEPRTPGDKSAGLRLSIAEATTPYVLLFTGKAHFPLTSDLDTSDQTISFGQLTQNSNAESSITLTNDGDLLAPDINISAILFSGTNADEFSTDFQPTTLEHGEELDVSISLATGVTGFKSATAEIYHDGSNGGSNGPLQIELTATVKEPGAVPVNFSVSTLDSTKSLSNPTTLQFGPDDKLYVGEMDGWIHVFEITRSGKDNYDATLETSIDLIKNVENHNDDGTRDWANKRLLTGIHVTGSATQPIIYAASSDPRQAAGPSGNDVNLDTNSGILHKLTKNGNNWTKQDLVRGLPRSEENHVANGLVLVGDKIYLNIGGNTNEGVPSNNFAELPEYALSAAVLEIDLDMIGNTTYDIPTLDVGLADQYDPFGGHDGLNQAMLVLDGPIKIFASGVRNAYDIVYTQADRFYVWDNGPNTGWGGRPGADCLNTIDNGGSKSLDGLHLISRGYYAGHPNPTRGNKANTFGGQSPIEGPANPIECEYLEPGDASGALTLNNPSTNGLDEYVASNFNGAMENDLIAAAMNGSLYRVQLNEDGDKVTSKVVLEDDLGQAPLDVTTQGDDQVFPGTIWVADFFADKLFVLEPADY